MLLLDPGEKKNQKKSENKIPLLQYGVDPLPRLPMVGVEGKEGLAPIAMNKLSSMSSKVLLSIKPCTWHALF